MKMRFSSTFLILLFFCLLPAIPRAQQPEKAIGPWKYRPGVSGAAKLLPDVSVIGILAGGYFSTEPAGDTGHDPERTGITLQEIELALQSTVDAYFKADVFVGFEEDVVELEEAYLTTLGLPKGFQIRAGKMLLKFGRENTKHLEARDFIDSMLVNNNFFGPENLNELGVEFSALFPLPFFLEFQGSFSNGANADSFGSMRKQDFLYHTRLSTSFDVSANATLLFGSSSAWGFNDTGPGNLTQFYGGDMLVKWKPSQYRSVTWQTEYMARHMEIPGTTQTDGGFYTYIVWQFLKRWHAALRYDQLGVPEGAIATEWRLTPALTFNPTEFSRIRAQFSHDKTQGATPLHTVFLQLEYSMGPHGAHAF